MKGDVTLQVDQTTSDARTLKTKVERRLPSDLERAKAAGQKIGNRAQNEVNALKQDLPGKVNQIQKAGENVRDRVEKSVEKITSPHKDGPNPSQPSAPTTPETPDQQRP